MSALPPTRVADIVEEVPAPTLPIPAPDHPAVRDPRQEESPIAEAQPLPRRLPASETARTASAEAAITADTVAAAEAPSPAPTAPRTEVQAASPEAEAAFPEAEAEAEYPAARPEVPVEAEAVIADNHRSRV